MECLEGESDSTAWLLTTFTRGTLDDAQVLGGKIIMVGRTVSVRRVGWWGGGGENINMMLMYPQVRKAPWSFNFNQNLHRLSGNLSIIVDAHNYRQLKMS